MRIIWNSNGFLQPTGYATVCKNVVPYIQEHSHHQMIHVANSGFNRVMPFDWNGVKVYGSSGYGGQLGIGDWQGIQAIEKPDVWLLNFDGWATGPEVVRSGVKYVMYPPIDHDPLAPPWLGSLSNAVEIVPYCKFGERVLKHGLGITAPIATPIPHGVDIEAFHPIDVDRVKVFGRDVPGFVVGIFKNNQGTRSRYDVQLAGFKMFLDRVGDKNARLYIHSNKTGPQGFNIPQLVARLGLEGYVYMVGPTRYRQGLSLDEMAGAYNACDVILNAVAGEGWGLPIVEAFACGKPVIGTAFSSMPELIAGVEGEVGKRSLEAGECIEAARGWLVPTSGKEYTLGKQSTRSTLRSEDVAAALVQAYEHPEKREAMGKNAQAFAQQFAWDKVGQQWVDYFDDLEKRIIPKQYSWKPVAEKPMKGKTACVVFSFNRPDYLVKTLTALSKAKGADDCDWYLFQDGWKNDPKHPYTTPEGEADNEKKVKDCLGILEGFPFARKRILAKRQNVCIGRQLQEAKALLFDHMHIEDAPYGKVNNIPNYEHVIFFDDDQVVGKDYLNVLLRLHEQFPDAVVGAQATERINIPMNATLDEVGITMKQTGKRAPGRWRWLGYLLPAAVHKATVERMEEYMHFIGPSYRDIPHNAVRIKYGIKVTGFDGMMDKICDDEGIPRIATVIPRARYIGEYGLFGTPQLFKQMDFPQHARYEFDDEPDTFHIRGGDGGLDRYAKRVFSQNGEDGIIKHIFNEIGITSHTFLEFGFAVPECNTWRLMKEEGFKGQYIDASKGICDKATAVIRAEGLEGIKVTNAAITAENIEKLTARLPQEIDILSMDIDGNDYWVWKALERISPRVVVIEYNASIDAGLSKTIPYDPEWTWHGGDYYGASLEALTKLGQEKGYRLIGCGPGGVNAFFLRNDVRGSTHKTVTPAEAYRSNPKTAPRQAGWKVVEGMPWIDV